MVNMGGGGFSFQEEEVALLDHACMGGGGSCPAHPSTLGHCRADLVVHSPGGYRWDVQLYKFRNTEANEDEPALGIRNNRMVLGNGLGSCCGCMGDESWIVPF
jgi:hypothetical protein